jgi:GR25 family glycosyltransferase involved in LPS biosynthesis
LASLGEKGIIMVPVYCITLDKQGNRALRTVEEFRPCGVTPTLFLGIDARKWGVKTSIKMKDHLGEPYYIAPTVCGCTLSHWMLWNHLITSKVREAIIVEDDVKLCLNFQDEFSKSYAELPPDWEFTFVGCCCADGRMAYPITERVWNIQWPMCTHCYLVKLAALEKLLEPMAELRTPVDIALIENVFQKGIVRPHTMRPNLALQYDTYIPP